MVLCMLEVMQDKLSLCRQRDLHLMILGGTHVTTGSEAVSGTGDAMILQNGP